MIGARFAPLVGSRLGRPRPAPLESPVDARVAGVVLALATILAAALRLPFLSHQSLWFDETYTRQVVGAQSLGALWTHVEATESTPPLYYLIVWLLGGRSAAAMRLVDAVSLIAAVPVGYLALRRLVGQRPALAAAAILAVSPILVSYSTDARSYGLLVLTALLSVWGFSAVLERSTPLRYAAWAAAAAACVWTHYFGLFLVAGEVALLLVMRPPARASTLGFSVLTAVALIPLVALVLKQNGDERAAFIAGIPLQSRLVATVRQFALGPNVPRTWLEAAGLAIACAGLALGAVLSARSAAGPRAVLALVVIAFAAPLVLAVTGIEDRFYVRNLVAIVPLLAGLAAPALLRVRAAPLALYLALAAFVSLWVATDWRYQQSDWRAVLQRAEAIDPNAAVVAVTRLSAPVVRTYLGRSPVTASISARTVWIAVEPVRRSGQRGLAPAPVPPAVTADLFLFHRRRQVIVHGFRLIMGAARRPVAINPDRLSGATVFPPRGKAN